jgi:hypothetical protein
MFKVLQIKPEIMYMPKLRLPDSVNLRLISHFVTEKLMHLFQFNSV